MKENTRNRDRILDAQHPPSCWNSREPAQNVTHLSIRNLARNPLALPRWGEYERNSRAVPTSSVSKKFRLSLL